MYSAFGVDHGEVSKSYSPGKLAGLERASRKLNGDGRTKNSMARYADARLAARKYGKEGDKSVGQGASQAANYYKGKLHRNKRVLP